MSPHDAEAGAGRRTSRRTDARKAPSAEQASAIEGGGYRAALLVTVAGGAACIAGLVLAPERLFPAWLAACIFGIDVTVGALFIVLLHHLSGGRWGVMAAGALKAVAGVLPVALLAFLPLTWSAAGRFGQPAAAPTPQPTGYFATLFVLARTGLYFLVWLSVLSLLHAWRAEGFVRRSRVAAGGVIVSVLAATMFAVDWVLAFQPPSSSTAIGFVVVTGQSVAGLAATILLLALRHRTARDDEIVAALQDLGNLLLAAIMLWAYVSFMQYLIIWEGNLPDEIAWYVARREGAWPYVGMLLLGLQFALPFAALMFRRVKRSPPKLAAVAACALVGHMFQVWWMVLPAFADALSWQDGAAVLAVSGLCAAALAPLWRRQTRFGAAT